MSQSFGPTMIIDQCESAHQQHPPPPSRSTPTGSARTFSDASNITSNSASTMSLNADSDEEQQLLTRPTRSNGNASQSFSNHLEARNSFNLMHSNSYGSLRYRTNPATSPLLEHVAPESIRFQVVVWDVGPVDVALGRVPMSTYSKQHFGAIQRWKCSDLSSIGTEFSLIFRAESH